LLKYNTTYNFGDTKWLLKAKVKKVQVRSANLTIYRSCPCGTTAKNYKSIMKVALRCSSALDGDTSLRTWMPYVRVLTT
jgi:hypothetical protein